MFRRKVLQRVMVLLTLAFVLAPAGAGAAPLLGGSQHSALSESGFWLADLWGFVVQMWDKAGPEIDPLGSPGDDPEPQSSAVVAGEEGSEPAALGGDGGNAGAL